jgi:hypothetical protein
MQDNKDTLRNDEEFQRALVKVKAEFQTLTAGNPEMSIEEAVKVRDYIAKRTDLEKPEEMLTAEEKAWKVLFLAMGKQLAEKMGESKVEELDRLKSEMDRMQLDQQKAFELLEIGRQIEELLLHQWSFLNVHFSGDNSYRRTEEQKSDEMVAPSTQNQKRVEIAKEILDINEKYKNLLLTPLFSDQDKIYELLTKYKDIYNQTSFHVEGSEELGLKLKRLYGDWLTLTEELHSARLKGITAVRNSVQLDAMIPNHIIANNGDITINLPTKEFAEKCSAFAVLGEEGNAQERRIAEKRDPLSIEVLGKPETYMKAHQNETAASSPTESKAERKSHRWGLYIVIVIILLIIFAVVGGKR